MTPTDIRNLRHKLGISQSELGRRIGIKLRQVQNLEAGSSKPSGSVLMLLEQLMEKGK